MTFLRHRSSMSRALRLAACLGIVATVAAQDAELPAGLDPKPLVIDAFGLSFNPPAGATAVTEKVSDTLRVSLSDSQEPALRTWTMRIAPVSATREGIDAAGQIESYLGRLRATRVQHRVLVNEPTTHGVGGQFALVEQTTEAGPSIAGWLILDTGDPVDERGHASFIVFSITARADQLEHVRSLLEDSFSTIELTSVAELSLARRARLERGRAFLDGLSRERLEALAGTDQWLRIYRPGGPTGGGEQELGYTYVQIASADRSAVDSAEPAGSDAPGLLVRVQARVILDADTSFFYDSVAEYWLAWDGTEEAWIVRATQRRGGEPLQTSAETGIRIAASTGDPQPVLNVISQSDQQRIREPYRWTVPDVYLSQALGWVLAALLPTEGGEPVEMSYYYYFPNPKPRLTLRRDVWSPAGDGAGRWVLTTRLSSDAVSIESLHEADGTLVRRRRPDGSVTEPIELVDLEKLWRRKGLMMRRRGR